MTELLPRLRLPALATGASLDPTGLFAVPPRQIWFEIGFGDGEHLAWQAAANPDVGFIAAEPYVNGVAALLSRIAAENLANIRIFDDDVRPLLAALPAGSIDRVFILFPDPWPKARHRRRRIVNAETLSALARLIAVGGELRLATDDRDYARWMLRLLLPRREFLWRARGPADWRRRPPDWPSTRYERKSAAAGRTGIFLSFARL